MEVLLSVSLLVFLCGGFPVYLSTRHESLMSTEKNAVASFYLRKAREDTKYLFYNLNQSFFVWKTKAVVLAVIFYFVILRKSSFKIMR